jgi:hypothetical protein
MKLPLVAAFGFALCAVRAGADDTPPTPPPLQLGNDNAPASSSGAPASSNAAASNSTVQKLDESQKYSDSGRALQFFYIEPSVGVGFTTIGSVIPNTTVITVNGTSTPVDLTHYRSGFGPVVEIGAGVEFIVFQAGLRYRRTMIGNYAANQLGGEVMYQWGSGKWWPHLGASLGYAWISDWNNDFCAQLSAGCNNLSVNGISVGVRGGVQYFVTKELELGANLTGDAMFLHRNAFVSLPNEASDTGLAIALVVSAGLHL